MPAVALYAVVAIVLILVCRRYVPPLGAAAAVTLVLLPLCFTGRALVTGNVYGPIDLPYMSEPLSHYKADYGIDRGYNGALSDLHMHMIPGQRAVRDAVAARQWPLWNRRLFTGSVLAANMQSAPYDPLQAMGWLLPHPQAVTFGAAIAFFCAGLFTYLFARSLARSGRRRGPRRVGRVHVQRDARVLHRVAPRPDVDVSAVAAARRPPRRAGYRHPRSGDSHDRVRPDAHGRTSRVRHASGMRR